MFRIRSKKKYAVLPLLIATSIGLMTLSSTCQVRGQSPRILISTNQMNNYEARHAAHLRADGAWFLGYNSPDVDFSLWQYVCGQIGTSMFVSEDGTINEAYLMADLWAPRLMLKDNSGRWVSAPGSGQALVANVTDLARSSQEMLQYYSVKANTVEAVRGLMSRLPTDGQGILFQSYNPSRLWAYASGGGGASLLAGWLSPSYWSIFGIHKLNGGDSTIRSGDLVALQTWNGFFSGGNYITSDLGLGGTLVANGGLIGASQTFTVAYPNEYVTARQIAPITHVMTYMEPDGTLSLSNIDEISRRLAPEDRNHIVVLTRSFANLSDSQKEVLRAVKDARCRGVVFEYAAGDRLPANFYTGIDAICSQGKDCFFLLPPRWNCVNYTSDIAGTISQLQRSPWYRKLNIVLACYRREKTNVGFLGGANSVEGALQWLKSHR